MKIGGRLVLPLTPEKDLGFMLMVTRKDTDIYAATAIMGASFIPCIGARDDASGNALAEALRQRPFWAVKSLVRDKPSDNSAWCVGTDWWLSTAEPSLEAQAEEQ